MFTYFVGFGGKYCSNLSKMQIFPLKLMKIDIYFFSQNITAVLQYSDLTYFLCFFDGSCNSPVEL